MSTPRRSRIIASLLWYTMFGVRCVTGQTVATGVTLSDGLLALGVEGGKPSQVFGEITGVITLPNKSVLVLDAKLGRLSLFSPQGTLLDAVGRSGEGPGEFVDPRLAAVWQDSAFVLDNMLRRVSVFALGRGAITFERSFGIAGWAADACLIGKRLFLLSYADGRVLHEYSLGGTLLRSFGEPIGLDLPITRGGTIRGRLLCEAETGMIVALARQFGTVAAYSAQDGRKLWATVPGGFTPAQMTPYDGGEGLRIRPGKGGIIDYMVAGVFVAPNLILTQARRVKYTDKSNPSLDVVRSTRTFLLHALTGKELTEARSGLPLIVEAGNGHAWTADTTDFPRVVRRRLQVPPQDH